MKFFIGGSLLLNHDPFFTEDQKNLLAQSPGYYHHESSILDNSKISSGKGVINWSKDKKKRKLEFPLQSTTASIGLGPGSYNPKIYTPRYKLKEKGSAFTSKDKKGIFGELIVGRVEKEKLAKNLQYIVDLEPGPGAYYSEKNSSCFHKKFDRLRRYQDFQLGDVRFKEKLVMNNLGPGHYEIKDDWVWDKRKEKKRKNVPFNSSAEKKSMFLKSNKDVPGPSYISKMSINPKFEKAKKKKEYLISIKQQSLKTANEQRELLHKPFRDKFKAEKEKTPGPGEYNLERKNRGKLREDPVFRSSTEKLTVFRKDLKEKAPPVGYYLVENNSLATKLKKDRDYLERVKLPAKLGFNNRQPRFGKSEEKNFYRKLLELKQSLTAEQKMAKVIRKLYKGSVEYTTNNNFKPKKNRQNRRFNSSRAKKQESFPFNIRVIHPNFYFFLGIKI